MECQKEKMQIRLIKIGKSWLNIQGVHWVFSKPSKILPTRGLGLNKKEQNVNVFMRKVVPRSARLIWSPEKVNVDQTAVKIGQSWLNMQAVSLACSLF